MSLSACIWFDDRAEEAAKFYVAAFRACGREAAVTVMRRYPVDGLKPRNSVMTVEMALDGMRVLALNGGPHFAPTPAMSLMVLCRNQREIDQFWEALSAGGVPGRCGWLTDRFGVSWQVVPENMSALLADPVRAAAVMRVLSGMGKLDIGALRKAYDGGGTP